MSRLEELIQQLCPDGVEYKYLGDVCSYATERIDAAEVNADNYVGVENLLPDKQGKTVASYVPSDGRWIHFRKDDILIGNIRPYLKKIWLATHDGGTNGDVLVIQIKNKNILRPQFLYYILSSDSFFNYDMQNAKGAKMPRGDKSAVLRYSIPLPPLPVQQEIVRILDSFTELTAELTVELTVELTARKKQYEYYRDALLTFEDDTPTCKMGEVLKFLNGRAYKQSELLGKGKYPVLRVGNFYTNDSWYYSDLELPEDKYCNEGDLLYSWAATLGPKIWRGERCIFHYHIWKILFDESVIDKTYLYYYLQHDLSLISRSTTKSTMIHVSMGSMKERPIKLPSIVEQRRIASLISKFDDLSSSITDGLPAEIEARKKQYEYYRDKLLSFKVKT